MTARLSFSLGKSQKDWQKNGRRVEQLHWFLWFFLLEKGKWKQIMN